MISFEIMDELGIPNVNVSMNRFYQYIVPFCRWIYEPQ